MIKLSKRIFTSMMVLATLFGQVNLPLAASIPNSEETETVVLDEQGDTVSTEQTSEPIETVEEIEEEIKASAEPTPAVEEEPVVEAEDAYNIETENLIEDGGVVEEVVETEVEEIEAGLEVVSGELVAFEEVETEEQPQNSPLSFFQSLFGGSSVMSTQIESFSMYAGTVNEIMSNVMTSSINANYMGKNKTLEGPIVGEYYSMLRRGSTTDPILVKHDVNGNVIWVQQLFFGMSLDSPGQSSCIGGSNNSCNPILMDMAILPNGNVVVVGGMSGQQLDDVYSRHSLIAQMIDSTGNLGTPFTVGSNISSTKFPAYIAALSDNTFVVATTQSQVCGTSVRSNRVDFIKYNGTTLNPGTQMAIRTVGTSTCSVSAAVNRVDGLVVDGNNDIVYFGVFSDNRQVRKMSQNLVINTSSSYSLGALNVRSHVAKIVVLNDGSYLLLRVAANTGSSSPNVTEPGEVDITNGSVYINLLNNNLTKKANAIRLSTTDATGGGHSSSRENELSNAMTIKALSDGGFAVVYKTSNNAASNVPNKVETWQGCSSGEKSILNRFDSSGNLVLSQVIGSNTIVSNRSVSRPQIIENHINGTLNVVGGLTGNSMNPEWAAADVQSKWMVVSFDNKVEVEVEYDDTPTFDDVEFTVRTTHQNNGYNFTNTDWLRARTTDTTCNSCNFDSQHTAAVTANKGSFLTTRVGIFDAEDSFTADANGKYWIRSTITNGATNSSILIPIIIDNIYTQANPQRRGHRAGNPSDIIYGPEGVAEAIGQAGIAYDLDTTATTGIISTTANGGTTVVPRMPGNVFAQYQIPPKSVIGWGVGTLVTAGSDMVTLNAITPSGVATFQHAPVYRTLTYNLNGSPEGWAPMGGSIQPGTFLSAPANPTWTGNQFVGWHTNPAALHNEVMWNFAVDTMPDANTTLYAIWKTNTPPVLNVTPTTINLSLNDSTFNGTQAELLTGVTYSDSEDFATNASITTAANFSITGSVDKTTPGIYPITYMVEDSDGNQETMIRTYIVGSAAMGTNYAIFAHDFVRDISDAATDTNAQIIANAGAMALNLDGVSPNGTINVVSVGSYASSVGTHAITFEVVEEPGLTTTIDGYVFNNIVANEVISATDFAIKLSDINMANLISNANVVVEDISTLPPTPVAGAVQVISVLPTTVGVHAITFESPTGNTTATVNAYVFEEIDTVNNKGIMAQDFTRQALSVQSVNAIINAGNVRVYDLTNLANPVDETTAQITANNIHVTPTSLNVGLNQSVTYTVGGTSLTTTVTANIYDLISNGVAINGSDFNIQLLDVNDANIRTNANVAAWDVTNPTTPIVIPTASIGVSHTITNTGVGQPVTFTANGEIHTVNANVFNHVNTVTNEALSAIDFIVPLANATNSGYKLAANVQGWDITNPAAPVAIPAANINVDPGYPFPTTPAAAHSVKFVTTSGTDITVQGTVIATNITLTANDFVVSLPQAQAITESQIITLSSAFASTSNPGTTTTSIAPTEITKLTSLTAANPAGVNIVVDAQDTTGDSTQTTIKVYVHDVVVGNVAWSGNDFNILHSNISDANIRTAANVDVWDITNPAAPVQVPQTNITVTHAITGTGVGQAVTFGALSETYTVNVNVLADFNPSTREGLVANDFTVPVSHANNNGYKQASGVQGWDLTNPSLPVAIPASDINVDLTYIFPTTPMTSHQVNFVTTLGTSTSVQATVIATNISMSANDFTIMLPQAATITESQILTLAAASATTTNPGGTTSLSVAPGEIAKLTSMLTANPTGENIIIDAQDTTGDSTQVTIKVYVYDLQIGNVAWVGNDFNIQLGSINDVNIRAAAGVEAWDVTNPALPVQEPVANISVTHTITATGTGQLVTFGALSATHTVNANVFDSVNPGTNEALTATNFTVPVVLANNAGYKAAANVQGWDITNPTAPVAIPASDINVVGTYTFPSTPTPAHTVTFETNVGTTINVQATVVNTNITATANNFGINLTQAGTMTNSQILALSAAAAITTNPSATTSLSVSPTEVAKLTSLTSAAPTGVNIVIDAQDTSGDATQTIITVYVYDGVVGNVAWTGDNFNISLTDVANDTLIRTVAGVTAWDITNPAAPVAVAPTSIAVAHTITGVGMGQPVTFSTLSENYTVNANVFDIVNPGFNEALTANDFTVALSNAHNVGYKAASGVQGWDITNPSSPVAIPLTDINVDSGYTYPIVAMPAHPVTFETNAGTTVTVQATVHATNISLNANDFTIDLATAQTITDLQIEALASAVATTTNPGTVAVSINPLEVAKLTSLTSAVANGVNIVINANDTTGDSTQMTIKVYVYDNVVGSVAWVGNDFNINLADVSNDAMIKALSGVEAWDITNPAAPVQELAANITVAHTITNVGNAQAVAFSALSDTYTVNANVFTHVNTVTNEALSANNFTVAVIDTNNAGYKLASNIAGWDITNPSAPVAIPLTDINVIAGYPFPTTATPAHPVTFETTTGTIITVQVTVIDTNITLNANDFAIDLATAQTITDLQIESLAGAIATTTNPGTVAISINPSEVAKLTSLTASEANGVNIVIDATDTTGDSTQRTIKVYVYDNVVGSVAWIGNDFNINFANVNDANIRTAANVEAWDITNPAAPVQELAANIVVTHTITGTGNAQAVAFSALSDTYTVNANVFNNVNTVTNQALTASDFSVPVSSANNAGYKAAATVQGWDITNPSTPVAIPLANIDVASGYIFPTSAATAHPVTFVTTVGTSVTVQATVLNTNITLNANDFAINLTQASGMTDSQILTLASANATTTNPGTTALSVNPLEVAKLTSLTAADTNGVNIVIDATDTTGDSTQVTIKVYVYDGVAGSVAWVGNDFNINLADVNDADIKNLSGVEAWDITNPAAPVQEPLANITVTHTITTTGLGQTVTFNALAQNYTVNANVFDNVNTVTNEALIANDFSVSVVGANNAGYKAAASVQGWDITNPAAPVVIPLTDINVVSGYTFPTVATPAHPVTFETNAGTTVTVQATVLNTNITLTANDFTVDLTTANTITDTQILALASAAATTTNPGTTTVSVNPLEVAKLTSLTSANTAGVNIVIDATDTTGDSTQTTIRVYVYDVVSGTVAWKGTDFNINLANVNDLNIKNLSGVGAWDITNPAAPVQEPVANITVTHTITATGLGQLVTFTALSDSYTVNANVFDNVNTVTNEALSATDFTVPVMNANNAGYLAASGVVGWDITNPASPVLIPATDINVDPTYIYPTAAAAAHAVDFVTNSGTIITVQATVIATNITLTANNFTVDLPTAQAITDTQIIALASAVATTANPGTTAISIAPSEVAKLTSLTSANPTGVSIVIDAIDTAGDSTQITINVQVFDVFTANIAWSGANFNIQLADVTDANIRTASGIEAWDITIPTAPVQIPTASITVAHTITAVGNAQVVNFSTTGQTYSVLANVFDLVNTVTNEALSASNFTVPVVQANNAGYLAASGVVGWDITNPATPVAIPPTDINVDPTYIYPTNARAAHAVDFVTNSGTIATVQATVVNSNISLTANNFVVDLPTAQAITDTQIEALASAIATTTNPGTTAISIAPSEVAKLTSLTAANPTGVSIVIDATDTTGDSTQTTITVQVFDVFTANIAWSGTNFNIQLADVTDANIRAAAGVEAWDITIPTAPVQIPTASITVAHTITAVGNAQVVNFSTTGQTYSVLANVFDLVNTVTNEALSATDFTVAVIDANNAGYLNASGIVGWDITNPLLPVAIPATDINVDPTYIYPTVATPAHAVNFVTNSGTIATVQATIVASNITLTANNFAIDLPTAQAITDLQIEALAGAVATTTNPGTTAISIAPSEVAKLTSLTAANPSGVSIVIDATDTVGDSTQITINVQVFDIFTANIAWSGANFNIQLADVNDANIRAAAGVEAWDITIPTAPVQIPTASINVAHTITAVGNAQVVTFSTTGQTYGVLANVFDLVNPVTNEAVSANNFTVPVAQANNAGYLNASSVVGWDITNPLLPVAIPATDINVDPSYIYPTVATPAHGVNFVTNNGTIATVQATVINSNITLTANDFTIDLPTAQAITATQIEALAGAIATTTNPGTTTISIAPSEVAKLTSLTSANPAGVNIIIDAQDTTGDSETITITVYVHNILMGTVAWSGVDFNIALSDVNDANIKTLSGVEAWDITNPANPVQEPNANITVSHAITTVGVGQVVTFSALSGSYTVNANVFTIQPTTEALIASDFTVTLSSANNSGYKMLSGVQGWDVTNPAMPVAIPMTDINVDSSYVYPTTAMGAHPVDFVTTNGTTITVNVTVVESNITVTASDFTVILADAQTITDTQILTLSGAVATTTNPGTTSMSISPSEVAKLTSLTMATPSGVTIAIDATDTTGDSTKEFIQVYVFDVTNNDVAWIGFDFNIQLADVNDDNIRTLSKVEAWDITNPSSPIQEATTNIAVAHNITAVGNAQQVTFSALGESYNVNANVFNQFNPATGIGWSGNDFNIQLTDVNDANIISGSNVAAWIVSGATITPISANDILVAHSITATGLGQGVTFTESATGNSSSHNVTANVFDGTDGIEAIVANDFKATIAEVSVAEFITLAGATAYDVTTNPATEITGITISSPLPTTDGIHPVTFVTPNGNVSITVQAEIYTVKPPVVNPIYPENLPLITGEGEPGSTIEITLPDGSQVVIPIGPDGNWTAIVPGPLNPGDTIIIVQKDQDGGPSTPIVVVLPPAQPIVNPIESGNNPTIGGTGTPGDVITITLPDGSQVNITIDSDGNWSGQLPGPLTPGDKVTIVQVDSNTGAISKPIEISVDDSISNYELLANDARATLSAVNRHKEAGTLEDYVLEITGAKVVNTLTQEELKPSVDFTALSNFDLAMATDYEIEVSYTLPAVQAQAFSVANANNTVVVTNATLSKTVTVSVHNDAGYISGLPVTGDDLFAALMVGLVTSLVSLVILLIVKRKRDANLG